MKSKNSFYGRFAVLALLAFALPAAAQVTFDAASNATPATVSTAASIAVKWNHTVGLSKKPYLTVGVSIDRNAGAQTVATLFYGTEGGGPNLAMTLLGSVNNGTNVRTEIWGLAGPTSGTHEITVTVANAGGQNTVIVAGAKSFFNVFQTAATGTAVTATGNTTTPTSPALTNSSRDYVVDAVAFNGNNALAATAGQTDAYNVTSAAPVFSGAGSIKTGVNNTTTSWTAGAAQQWAIVAVPLIPATPQILFDAKSSASVTSTANPIVLNWNHTTTNAANRYVVVGVAERLNGGTVGTNVTISGVTYGGTAMTFLGRQTRTTTVNVELWGLANPATGTQAIAVTVANTGARNLIISAGAQTFSNVDQNTSVGTAAGANNNSTNPTVAVTNVAHDYVVDVVGFNTNQVLTEGARQDDRWTTVTGGLNFSAGSSGARGYVNTTMSWDSAGTATNWAIEAIPLKVVTVGLTKTASADVIKLGTTVTYTLTATNYTAAAANNVIITDAIPAGAVFVSQTGCAGAGPVTCNIGTLAAGATSAAITVTVRATAAGTISNFATVSYNGLATKNNSETVNTVAESRICASPGKDGAGGTLAGIKNDYWPGTTASAAVGATTFNIGARNGTGAGVNITAGDLLIVMQMQDAAFDITNDETYGEGTGSTKATGTGSGAATTLNNAGRWEYVVATNTVTGAGGALTFSGGGTGGGLLYSYTNQAFAATTTQGQRTYQVIRVPQYSTATFGSTLTAATWNGNTGGVLAIDVSGTLTLGGATVSVDGKGFRGGGGRQLTGVGAGTAFLSTDFATPATAATNGSKGEGITGTPRYIYQHGATIGAPASGNAPLDTGVEGYLGGSYGRGAPGNAGGGSTDGDVTANQDNSGGGGGGNAGFGGPGGFGWNCNCASGGQGGGGISPSLTRITMGGGGGAGTTNNASAETCNAPPTCRVNVPGDWTDTEAGANGYYSSGANGGGVVIVRAMQATGTATITANGYNAYNVGRDGAGGGGAGGSVLFTTQAGVLTGLTIQATGGDGGNAWVTTLPAGSPGERHGPGGGGGGGYVLLSSAAASVDVSGGGNGVTDQTNDFYGARPGTIGTIEFIAGNNVLPGGDGASCAIVDLSVTNTDAPDPVVEGQNITYTQSVTNNGPNAADSVVFSQAVPASCSFQSITPPAGWTCITPAVGAAGNIVCTTPSMANAVTANFSLVVKVNQGTPPGYIISDTVNASTLTNESNYANNTATTTTNVSDAANADLRLAITAPATVVTGTNYNYTQTVTNGGLTGAANPSFTETTPPGTTFQSITPPAGWSCITPAVNGTGAITCTSGTTLASGGSLSFPLTLKATGAAGSTITLTGTDATTTKDPYLPNNTSSAVTKIVNANTADIGVTMTASPTEASLTGDTVQFTDVITNNGVVATNATFVAHTVPPNTTFAGMTIPAGWSCVLPAIGAAAGSAISCSTTGTLAVGASSTFIEKFTVVPGTASGTVITNPLTVNVLAPPAGVTDSDATNNTASASINVRAPGTADLGITKTDSPDPIGSGQFLTYLLRIVNNGPEQATGITTSDTLDTNVDFISASPSQGTCAGTTTITCNLGSLSLNGSATVKIIVQAKGGFTGTLNNTATVTGTKTDPVAANNSSSAPTTVLAVTLVRLRDFSASLNGKKVTLNWQTEYESDNLGFNLWREIGGQRVQINDSMIAGSALQSKKTETRSGYNYRFKDKDKIEPGTFVQYWLEDVDLNGTHTLHGPVSPTPGSATTEPDSDPLPGLGANGNFVASQEGLGVVRPLTIGTPTSGQFKQQYDLASDTGLKIYVTKEGWYRVTRAAMAAAGYDPGNDGKKISVYVAGIEQQVNVDEGGDNKFDAGDFIEFYGIGLDTASTGARTYWLRSGKGTGDRIKLSKDKGGDPVSGSVPFTYERKDRSIFFAAAAFTPDDVQNFFGPIVLPFFASTLNLPVANLDTSYGGNATLDVTVQGGTDNVHNINFSINGNSVGVATLAKTELRTFTFTFPQSYLANGTNTLSIQSVNSDFDASVMAGTRLTYQHLLRADNGALEVTLPGGRSVTVGGFAAGVVRAIDVTDAQHPVELETTVAANGSEFDATFTPSGTGPRVVLVAHSSRVLAPAEMSANRASSINESKGADLVIVSHSLFLNAASTLKPVRDAQGISTLVTDVEDVYDEFNFGIRDPQAIRTMLQTAQSWKTAPRFALLVGDASFDPRNYLGMGSFDYVPTRLVTTALMKTASDDWIADFNGDGVADLALGRIPVRTAAEAAGVFNKLTSRGTPSGTWTTNALFVTDVTTDFDFAGAAANIAALLPASWTKTSIDLTTNGNAAVVSAMNAGSAIADYIGHGSVEIWGTNAAFQSPHAAALTNAPRLPFVVTMTCLNGFFHDVFSESMAEALLKNPNGGAIAVWASSTLTEPDSQAAMNAELFRQLFGNPSLTIGEACQRAKTVAVDPDVKKSWMLFGDPSMKLK